MMELVRHTTSVRQANNVRIADAINGATNPTSGGAGGMDAAVAREMSPTFPVSTTAMRKKDGEVEDNGKGVWTTLCTDELMRKSHLDSSNSDADFPPETMLRRMQNMVQNHGRNIVFRHIVNDLSDVVEMSFEMLGEKVRRCAQALIQGGVLQFDKVCIAGAGSPTWAVAYLGVMSAGAIPCALYVNDTGSSHLAEVQRCGACAVITAEDHIASNIVSNLSALPNLAFVILWEEHGKPGRLPGDQAAAAAGAGAQWRGAFRWSDLMESEAGPDVRREHEQRLKTIRPGTCAAIVHTPGTAGQPKAVLLSHDNWSWTAQAVVKQIGLNSGDNLLACLPIASATAQLLFIHVALVAGCSVTFPPLLAGGRSWEHVYLPVPELSDSHDAQNAMIDILKISKPTMLVGSGWMWELIASALRAEIEVAHGTTAKTYAWALQQGKDAGNRLQGIGSTKGSDVGSKGMSWGVAKRVMFMKIWTNVGLDKCRYASGVGAYCNTEAMQLLLSVGIPVLWMYGSAESSGLAALSSSSKSHHKLPGFRLGYSGRALKGTALTVRRRSGSDSCWSGIYVKGRNVMMGYLNDSLGCAEILDRDGTLYTGDCGDVDWGTQLLMVEATEDALMRLSTKKEFSATKVEEALRKELPLLSKVVAVGHGMPFVVCLVTLETVSSSTAYAQNAKEARLTREVVSALGEMGVYVSTVEEAREDKTLTQAIIQGVQRANQRLGTDHVPVKRFSILSEDLQLARNELTPTLQLRRSIIIKKYANMIEDIYDDSLPGDRKKRHPDPHMSEPTTEAARPQEARGFDGSRDVGAAVSETHTKMDMPQAANRDWDANGALPSTTPSANLTVHQETREAGFDNGMREQDEQAPKSSLLPQSLSSPGAPHDTHMPLDSVDYWAKEDEREQQTAWHMRLEEAVLETNAAISNVMVVGDDRPFLSCFISLKTVAEGTDILHEDAMLAAQPFDSTAHTVTQAKDDPCFRAFLVDSIARVNRQFGQPGSAIRKFIILLVDFLPAIAKMQGPSALTTPMRDSIKRSLEKIIDSIYEGSAAPNPQSQGTTAANDGLVGTSLIGTSLNQSRSPGGFAELQHANTYRSHNGTHAQEPFQNEGASSKFRLGSPSLEDIFKAHDAASKQDTHDWYPSEFDRQQQRLGFDQAPPPVPLPVPQSAHTAQPPQGHNYDAHVAKDYNGLLDSSNDGTLYSSNNANMYDSHQANLYDTTAGGGKSGTAGPTKDVAYDTKTGEELVQLVLNLDMAHVLPNMQAFCTGLHSDVCWALNAHRDQVVVRTVSTGSIVTVALLPREDDDRSALDLARTLQEQATDSRSVLRQGSYTQSLISVTHIVPSAVTAERPAPTPGKDLENSLIAAMSCGVGLVLQQDDQARVLISRIIPGSPAALTRELRDHDVVIEIDGQSMIGVAADLVVAFLKGDKGSLVRMAVMRGDISRTVYMVRGKACDSVVPAIRVGALTQDGTEAPKQSSTPKSILPSTPLGELEASNGRSRTSLAGSTKPTIRLSLGTPSSISQAALLDDSQRALQVVNMAFEAINVRVWRRDGEVLIDQEISPNGAFPDAGNHCGEHWPIPPGRDLCFTVLLGREASSRKSFCLPEFDKRSVRVRIEVDNEKSLLSVAPVLRKGKPLQGNIDAYSLRLNALPETTGPAL